MKISLYLTREGMIGRQGVEWRQSLQIEHYLLVIFQLLSDGFTDFHFKVHLVVFMYITCIALYSSNIS